MKKTHPKKICWSQIFSDHIFVLIYASPCCCGCCCTIKVFVHSYYWQPANTGPSRCNFLRGFLSRGHGGRINLQLFVVDTRIFSRQLLCLHHIINQSENGIFCRCWCIIQFQTLNPLQCSSELTRPRLVFVLKRLVLLRHKVVFYVDVYIAGTELQVGDNLHIFGQQLILTFNEINQLPCDLLHILILFTAGVNLIQMLDRNALL